MSPQSLWSCSATLPEFPRLDRDLQIDAVVVGAGMTGIVCAYLLKRVGLRVALIERDRCGGVNTRLTSAHLTCIPDLRLTSLVDRIGRDHTRGVLDAGDAAIRQIEQIVQSERIDCDFKRVPGYVHASLDSDEDEREDLRREAELGHSLGLEAAFVETVPVFGRPGVRYLDQAQFHPLRFLAGLVACIPGEGSHVFEQSEAKDFSSEPLGLKSNGHKVQCEFIVIATDVPLQGKAGLISSALFQSKLVPTTSYVMAARLPRDSMPDALFWDTSDPYYFTRLQRESEADYLIFGGLDHKTGQEDDPVAHYARLEQMLLRHFPHAEVTQRWSGQVIESIDGLPFIGELSPRQFVATGYSGNGLTYGTLAAIIACDTALGRRRPWDDLFAVERKPLSKLWDYLAQNSDYPYYMLRDRLRRAAPGGLEDLGKGEGRLLRLDGQHVAAYRDAAGHVSRLNPLCTHLGCFVHWNAAESTWDCPCHGSRFKATGEVLTGPAEHPLRPL